MTKSMARRVPGQSTRRSFKQSSEHRKGAGAGEGEGVLQTRTTSKRTSRKNVSIDAESGRSKRVSSSGDLFGLSLTSWVGSAKILRTGGKTAADGRVFFFGRRDKKELTAALRGALLPWQLQNVLKSESEILSFAGRTGPVFILRPPSTQGLGGPMAHQGRLEKGAPARARDQVGSLVSNFTAWKLRTVVVSFISTTFQEESAALTGLEMGSYFFAENCNNERRPRRRLPKIVLIKTQLKPGEIQKAGDLGVAVNLARHLTNLPGNELNPRTYAEAIQSLFTSMSGVSVEVWSGEKLQQENMNLLAAVGRGAQEGPRLVHIRYRPIFSSTSKNEQSSKPAQTASRRPIALVGKGITFDSGGLDIKPSAGMRLMKKDMGGSAAAIGAAYCLARTRTNQPIDVYLSLAENAISSASFRPGDIIAARNGLMVEIHNTDAEGRLVMADALDVAAKQKGKDAPSAIIDVATLTGAIKIALGAEIAGLFSNNDELSARVETAASATGELVWRMPLHLPYRQLLKSSSADFVNSSDGFAGAITAALFLQQFTGQVPWAHLDIYAWRDSAAGACSEAGGSGQSVQLLAHLLSTFENERS